MTLPTEPQNQPSPSAESRRASEVLRQSEEKFARIFQSHPDCILLTSLDGLIYEANEGFTRLTGYTFEEARGHTTIELKIWENLEDRAHFIGAIRDAGRAAEFETRFRHRSGELRPCLVSGEAIEIDGQKVIVGLVRDITRRRQAEEALIQAEEDRMRHVALLEASLDTLNEGVIMSDLEGGLFYWNHSALKIHGYSTLDEVRCKLDTFADTYEFIESNGRVVPFEEWPLMRVLRGDTVRDWELRCRRRTDKWDRYMSYSGALAADDAGQPLLAVLTMTDITGPRQLEEQLRQSQKMDAIGQLAGGVAHDFNNLLTVILGNAGMIETSERITEEERAAAQEICLAAERASNLTRQLLTFSRRQVMQLRTLDLDVVVAETTRMLRRVLGENIVLQYESSSTLPAVQADRGMMEQVLMNLAINARDAMPNGGRLTIRTSAETVTEEDKWRGADATVGRFVCISVSDTGGGIAPEHLPHIFEPFFTTKDVGKGTGLGLATVYGIVRQHNGWLSVESTVDEGTTFEVFLPALQTQGEEEGAARPIDTWKGGTEMILLVEDEAAVRQIARAVLERLGYRVVEAFSGVEALEAWPKYGDQVDLLLTDLVMPGGVSGRDLSERLRALKPDLKVIYSSGYSADVTGGDFVLEEGVNFLQKPYEFHHLARTVRACLDGKKIGEK